MKISILAAMDKEMALIRNVLENPEEICIDNVKGYHGFIEGHEIILAKCGIGKVNAALNTLRIIRAFQPELVINSGVAGGAGGLKVGELLIASEVAYHDVWCGPGTVPGAADGYNLIFHACKRTLDVAQRFIGDEFSGSGVSYGLIATGDSFISREEEIRRIHSVLPNAVAVDMESAAIAQACESEGVDFNIIRVVSDTPGEADNLSQYQNFWSEAPEKTFHALQVILRHI